MPKRIQRSRAKGWRKPEGAVIVDRTSRWGNPFKVGDPTIPDRAAAVERFADLCRLMQPDDLTKWIAPLRGRDLVCFCPLDQPCHADVLLKIANED